MDPDDYTRVIPGSGQNIAIGAAAVASTAFGSQTYAVRIMATGACHVEFGGLAATAKSALIAPNVTGQYFKVAPGSTVSVIQDGTATGNCNIVEVTR